MDIKLWEHLIRIQSELHRIPFALYDGEECLCSFSPHPVSFDMIGPWLPVLMKEKSNPGYMMTNEMLLMGFVKDSESNRAIVIGPMRMGKLNERTIHDIVLAGRPFIQVADMKEVTEYLNACEGYTLEHFLLVLSSMHGFLNHVAADLYADPSGQESEERIHGYHDDGAEEAESWPSYPDYEPRLMFYVRHGLTDKIRDMHLFHGEMATLADNPLRLYKNAMIILNSLCQRAAIIGGLEPEISHRLGEVYIQKIEACRDISDLLSLNKNMRIPVDYSQRVYELIAPASNNPHIRKVVQYVRHHYQKRLTVKEIAHAVHLSKEYLSSKFHAEMGITLPAYISQQKIIGAKELLSCTDMTLVEIAEFLSFSSQSYFQAVFKRLTGQTPLEYRRTESLYFKA